MSAIYKTFEVKVLEKRKDGGRIIINTAGVDRDRDRVFPRGGRVDSYLKNPVVQWAHDYRSPYSTIGRSRALEISDEGIIADFELRPAANEQDPQNIVRLLWEGEWVRTASVGFIPRQGKPNDVGGTDFMEWELLEWSLVPIPANQDALRLAVKGFDAPIPNDADETARINARALELLKEHLNIEAKRGRVLSAANEKKLIAARDALNDVLAQLEREDESETNSFRDADTDKQQFENEQTDSENGSKHLDLVNDQKEVEPPSLPAEVATELPVELRHMLDMVESVFGVSRTAV